MTSITTIVIRNVKVNNSNSTKDVYIVEFILYNDINFSKMIKNQSFINTESFICFNTVLLMLFCIQDHVPFMITIFYIKIVYYFMYSYITLMTITHVVLWHLPGHIISVHGLYWMSSPGQETPPWLGGGWSHVRVLVLLPSSHVTEHALHSTHRAQAPFTVIDIFN